MEAIRVVVTVIVQQQVLMDVMCPFRPNHYKAEKKWKRIHLNLNGKQFNTCMHQVLLAAICTFSNSTPVIDLHNSKSLPISSIVSVTELKPQHVTKPRNFSHACCLHFFPSAGFVLF